jgi:hypothetical protein
MVHLNARLLRGIQDMFSKKKESTCLLEIYGSFCIFSENKVITGSHKHYSLSQAFCISSKK